MTPGILLVTTSRWLATARLAMAMARERCDVHVVCPPGHPVERVRSTRLYRYRATRPLQSIAAAISAATPDCVIPCDDLAADHLYRLYRGAAGTAGATMRALLERSLGAPGSLPMLSARTRLIQVAQALGIRAPSTDVVRSASELDGWLRRHSLPAVLKSDKTSGGRGVCVVRTPREAAEAMAALSAPPSAARAVKRALVNQDTNYLVPCVRRTRPVVNAQAFIYGRDANCAVACWQGTVLGRITVAVLQTSEPHGPASVVRLIENAEIAAAVAKIVRHFGLSGLVGFDFVLQHETGDPYLVEMNPRATQSDHLQLGPGRDLPAALRAALSGDPCAVTRRATSKEVIAYFPQEWRRDPASPFLQSAHHDVPWEEPDLIRAAILEPFVAKAWSYLVSTALAFRSARTHTAVALQHAAAETEGEGG
jgi:hypothetical protein